MRLINVETYDIEEFPDDDKRPRYTTLSHVWGNDEVTLQDMQNKKGSRKAGYVKIKKICELTAKKKENDLRHCWVDTCCIDKTSSAELSEAINSMYRWYAESAACYAFLDDVDPKDNVSLMRSKWFTRGWTLQELIAPPKMYFYDRNWRSMEVSGLQLREATSLPTCILAKELTPQDYSVAQRLSWAAKRETTRKEDMAYCLMGLLDVNMPLLYGEGGEKAFRRLQEEVIKYSADLSIFARTLPSEFSYSRTDSAWGSLGRSLLAPKVFCFAGCGSVRLDQVEATDDTDIEGFHLGNRGLSISLSMTAKSSSTYIAMLNCSAVHYHGSRVARCALGILLHRLRGAKKRYARVSKNREDLIYACNSEWSLSDTDQLQQQQVLIPLTSSFLFRDWSIRADQLTGDGTRWKPVPGTPSVRNYYNFSDKHLDFCDPTPGRAFCSYKDTGTIVYIPDSVIGAVRFGIDSNYNPVIFFFSAAKHSTIYRWVETFIWSDEEINNFIISPEDKWYRYGCFAVRGHWEHGVRAELHFLNLYLRFFGRKLWNINFKTLSEHVPSSDYKSHTHKIEASVSFSDSDG